MSLKRCQNGNSHPNRVLKCYLNLFGVFAGVNSWPGAPELNPRADQFKILGTNDPNAFRVKWCMWYRKMSFSISVLFFRGGLHTKKIQKQEKRCAGDPLAIPSQKLLLSSSQSLTSSHTWTKKLGSTNSWGVKPSKWSKMVLFTDKKCNLTGNKE